MVDEVPTLIEYTTIKSSVIEDNSREEFIFWSIGREVSLQGGL